MTAAEAAALLRAAEGKRILVVGDVMIDEYAWGDVARISPDAPVPVVDLKRRSVVPGGAANVALNLAAAGASPRLVGVVGDDARGRHLGELLAARSVAADGLVRAAGRRTTAKTRVVARGQQLVRLDEEDREPLEPGPRARLRELAAHGASEADGVIVSDYAKGVVDRALVEAVCEAAAKAKPPIPVVVDPKSRDLSLYRGCTAITPNRAETEAATGVPIDSDDDVAAAAAKVRAACGAEVVLVTRGDRGLSLWRSGAGSVHVPTRAREVFDVTGAGDTVIAYFALGLAAGFDPVEAAGLANAAAGVAVSRVGTTAVAPDDLVLALEESGGGGRKILDLAHAQALVERERTRGRRIVFTNGCFDLLHAGHVQLLDRARALGDLLVVAVNSDASIRRLKGADRPLVGESDRVRVLAALDAVGIVIVFDEDTPLRLIETLRPDVLVKGGDYQISQIVGADLVGRYGGRVETIPLVEGRSTTSLVDAIRRTGRGDS